jgi:hypothetical protein
MRIQGSVTCVVLLSAMVAACANIDARDNARAFGASGQRLKQLSAQISAEAHSGAILRAVILVARNGKIVPPRTRSGCRIRAPVRR